MLVRTRSAINGAFLNRKSRNLVKRSFKRAKKFFNCCVNLSKLLERKLIEVKVFLVIHNGPTISHMQLIYKVNLKDNMCDVVLMAETTDIPRVSE